ncbi:hypothetical protein ACWCQN_28560 [Streptomyces sp. NPDC001984]
MKDAIGHDRRGTAWQGRIHIWNDCVGGKKPATEAALSPAGGQNQPRVYVQLRQDGGSDATDRVLDWVRVTS